MTSERKACLGLADVKK